MQEFPNLDVLTPPQMLEAHAPGTAVDITDGCHGDTSNVTPDLCLPTNATQFDVVKAAALLAAVPIDEGSEWFPSPDVLTFDQPLTFTDDDLEVNYVPKETECDKPIRHGTKRKHHETNKYPLNDHNKPGHHGTKRKRHETKDHSSVKRDKLSHYSTKRKCQESNDYPLDERDMFSSTGTKRNCHVTEDYPMDEGVYFRMIDDDIFYPDTEPDGVDEIPLVKIEPIKRRRRVAVPMRNLLLRRLALKSSYKYRRYCCRYRCNDTWTWITKRRVFSDYE